MRTLAFSCIVLSILLVTISVFSQESGKVHIVRRGDTLWDLSSYYLHNPFLWPSIYQANETVIEDPHWIYPGEIFLIPPHLSRRGRLYSLEGERVAVQEVAAAEPMVAAQLAYKGGFLTADEVGVGYIVESERKEKENITSPDTVYIDLGEVDGVKPGDLFTIFRWGKKVKDPETGEYLGRIVDVLGKLVVFEVVENSSSAEVVQSFDIIKNHDMIMDYEAISIPDFAMLIEPEVPLEGRIAAAKYDNKTIIPFHIIYINLGASDGIGVGDYFEIYREGIKVGDPGPKGKVKLPEVKIGTLQVLRTTNESSTCYITDIYANMDIEEGETIRLIGRGPEPGEIEALEIEEEMEEMEEMEEEEEEGGVIEPE
jgi:hypothetical protein